MDSVQQVPPPHPDWAPPTKQPKPYEGGYVTLDPAEMESCYPLVISSIVPRPIALVSSLSAEGTGNVAPFSYCGAMAHDPPTIAVSVCRKPGGVLKDTYANVLATGEFVVNIMSDWFVESANHTCGNWLPEENEMELSGLTPLPSMVVAPPRIAESAVHFECKVAHTHDIVNKEGKVTATVILGEIVRFHVQEEAYDGSGRGEVRFDKLRPLSRLGGNTYGVTTATFDLPRPDRPKQGR
mmetsp:Transcript_11487/g.37772  ORF Transcript_11487/g.37772 Transcript_11487/m.37772 type:complete len:239 (-) Transcript_11487:2837-3553(-)